MAGDRGATWVFRAQGDRIVVHSITNADGVQMTLPGSWAEVVVDSPDEIGLSLATLAPEVLALYRGVPAAGGD